MENKEIKYVLAKVYLTKEPQKIAQRVCLWPEEIDQMKNSRNMRKNLFMKTFCNVIKQKQNTV